MFTTFIVDLPMEHGDFPVRKVHLDQAGKTIRELCDSDHSRSRKKHEYHGNILWEYTIIWDITGYNGIYIYMETGYNGNMGLDLKMLG